MPAVHKFHHDDSYRGVPNVVHKLPRLLFLDDSVKMLSVCHHNENLNISTTRVFWSLRINFLSFSYCHKFIFCRPENQTSEGKSRLFTVKNRRKGERSVALTLGVHKIPVTMVMYSLCLEYQSNNSCAKRCCGGSAWVLSGASMM